MSEWVIYHNPKCSKSRQTLALMEEKGIEPRIVEYLKTPLDVDQLKTLVAKLGISANELVRTKEKLIEEENIAITDDASALVAMTSFPKLMERPIVERGNKAVIGRPPENVLHLI